MRLVIHAIRHRLERAERGPHRHRQEEPVQSGIAGLLVKMLDQSTMKYEAAAIEEQLELLGSEVSISSDDEEINISITTLTRNLDATLALVEEKLLHPKFP